jgi:dihydropteroate synthase
VARGATAAAADGHRVLLVGTPRALRETATFATDASSSLASALETAGDGVL